MRVQFVNISKEQSILLFDLHHIITDGVSQIILKDEFLSLSSGKELSSIRLQYKDYSEWQNSAEQQELMRRQEMYWIDLYSNDIPVLNLPND